MVLGTDMVVGIGFTVLSGVSVYFFTSLKDHEKRIQKNEDTKDLELAAIKKEVADLDKNMVSGFAELKKQITDLSKNVHNQKNEENAINATLIAANKTMLELGNVIEKLTNKIP